MSCPKSPVPVSTQKCSINIPQNWKWIFPDKTIPITFGNPVTNSYNLGGKPVGSRAVCSFEVYDTGTSSSGSKIIPPCDINKGLTQGFFTRNGKLYIDSYTNLYCAYQIGRNSDGSYVMRSQDGATTSTLSPIS